MSAMPRARQVEQALESLAARKNDVPSQELTLQPQWRLVGRDGLTSSVVGTAQETKKKECLDCLAGRCGQNPQGCECQGGGGKATISLDRLTMSQAAETSQPKVPLGPSKDIATNAGMPQARPQLFEQVACPTEPTAFLELRPADRETFVPHAVASHGMTSADETQANSGPNHSEADAASMDHSPAVSVSPPQGDELQQVIDHWPLLPQNTRRAILALVGTSSEADSA